ncbi:MAG: 16S rRNA (cytosine(967)-C(5))-methyltransferase RsmB [Lachnospiraceae bacterium]|nr:16S rRNA (cytosine(967)-C(5))-methyltransferase RsmB [Lachnospiraceae bacterium]
MENIREIALDGLLTFEKELCFSNKLIKDILDKYDYLEGRDKAFLKRLFEGCVERRIELDYRIDLVSNTPVKKQKPFIRNLLRLATYQIIYMDSVPDSAAINEAVKLSKKRGFSKLSGFVNGVLRNISRGKDSFEYPDKDRDFNKYLSVKYSVPEWLSEFWNGIYGKEETEKILDALLGIHPLSLRLRCDIPDSEREEIVRKLEKSGVVLKRDERVPFVYTAEETGDISKLPGFSEGLFTVQDISSVLAILSAGIKKGDVVYDACAAPGGKSLLAAELAGETGRVVSCDLSGEKVSRITENAVRMKADNLTAAVWDACVTNGEYIEKADVLILDVPCSGLGVLGKKRDIKYNVTPEGIRELERIQWEIVKASYKYVKVGGVLLYSTCTINPGENEEQAKRITGELPFEILKGPVQLLPDRDKCDGFFYTVFRRTGK